MINGTKVALVSLVAITAYSISLAPPAAAKSKAKEFIKYLNPVPEKTYLNQSQDRVIKKKGFKTVEVPGAKPVENKELGFFAIVPLDKIQDTALLETALQNPDVNGLSVILPWRMLEPVEGETKFKPIDDLLAVCKKNNKTLILRVSTCGFDEKAKSDTPDWVFADPAVRSIVYVGTDGNEHQMPVFWDTSYLAKWSNLVNELGEQYDKNVSLHSVGITGGGIAGSTNVIPDFVASVKQTINPIPPTKGKGAEEPKGDSESHVVDEGSADAQEAAPESKPDDAGSTEKKGDDSGSMDSKTISPFRTAPGDQADTAGGAGSAKDAKATDAKADAKDDAADDKTAGKDTRKVITTTLEKKYAMTPRQLVEHWKYVADIFPKAFEHTRLNFDISPPTPNRKGQDALDEISDYLVYRYGQRVYLTRQNVKDGHHGFDDYRVLLKFHPDTLTGYRLRPDFNSKELDKLVKNAAEDGISFCEAPIELLVNQDAAIKTALSDMRQHMGYQLVSQAVTLPKDVKVGQKLTASFTFVNLGAAGAMKPSRQLDKDVASSYKVQLELRNESGKPIARLWHTPETPTNQWASGKAITWQEELKMPPQLVPGKYDVFLSLMDTDTKRKLRFLNASGKGDPTAEFDAPVGSIQVVQ